MEAKESAWRQEVDQERQQTRLDFARQLEEHERCWQEQRAQDADQWQTKVDGLVHQVAESIEQKELLEKSIRQQVDKRVQVFRHFFFQ